MRRTALVVCVLLLGVLPACRQKQPEAVRSLYRVEIVHDVLLATPWGTPIPYTRPGGGSATAVSADGDLLTARHVVDLAYGRPAMCSGYVVAVMSLRILVTAPDGRQWQGSARPAQGMPCDFFGRLLWEWDPTSTARVQAVDFYADLALIRLDAAGLEHLQMRRDSVAVGEKVVGVGLVEGFFSDLAIEEGTVVVPCMAPHGREPQLEMTQRLHHGMSGGPLVADGKLVGINVSIQLKKPYHSFAVPTTYAAAWYDWVKGRAAPPTVPCP